MKIKNVLPIFILTAFFTSFILSVLGFRFGLISFKGEVKKGVALGLQGQLAQGRCQPPQSGCPQGWWWDYYQCTCRASTSSDYPTGSPYPTGNYYPTGSPYPSPTISPEYYFTSSSTAEAVSSPYPEQTMSVDRLAQVDVATLSCIKTRLNEEEYNKLRFFVPRTAEEEISLRNVEEKARVCFESYSEISKIGEASREITEISPDVQRCLVNAVGASAYEEVKNGIRLPTAYEKSLGNQCFTGDYESKIRYQTQESKLVSEVENCLVLAVGEDKFERVKSGLAQITSDDRNKIERCFGASPQPFQGRPVFELPQEVHVCLKEGMGTGRYLAIASGRAEPTESEKAKGKECFDKLEDTQVNFLPPPPDQVPYLAASPDTIEVGKVSEKLDKISAGITDRKFVFSGFGPPNSLVDIYIFSEPIVVTTETDANGEWVYEMNQPLEEGTHVA